MKYIVQDGSNFGINVNTKSPKIMSSVLHLKKNSWCTYEEKHTVITLLLEQWVRANIAVIVLGV